MQGGLDSPDGLADAELFEELLPVLEADLVALLAAVAHPRTQELGLVLQHTQHKTPASVTPKPRQGRRCSLFLCGTCLCGAPVPVPLEEVGVQALTVELRLSVGQDKKGLSQRVSVDTLPHQGPR